MRNLTILTAVCMLFMGCESETPPVDTVASDTVAQDASRIGDRRSEPRRNQTPVQAPGTHASENEIVAGPPRTGGRPAPPPATNPPAETDVAAEVIMKVNLNTATEEEFLALPEVTERMAHEFDEYRPYASIRQFRREIGKYVDEAQVARYEQYVFVPIDINESDTETLQQIPGMSTVVAEAIIAARPFAGPDEFLAALTGHIDAETVELARSYLAAIE